jgi:ribonuclease BN (tRNA processing enzyme)
VNFHEVPHFTETYAMAISQNGGGRIVYGADCSPTEELKQFASEADLLVVEGTLPRPERTGQRGHLTPREAGEHGRDAGVKRLVVTHISDELDQSWAREEASDGFGQAVEIAEEGAVYEVPG